jgi:hypothetical protein
LPKGFSLHTILVAAALASEQECRELYGNTDGKPHLPVREQTGRDGEFTSPTHPGE